MSRAGPDDTGATRVSALTPLSDAVLKRLAWLDLSNAQHQFVAGAGAAASLETTWGLSLEYRRFLLLRLAYHELDITAPPLIDTYWRLHAADQDRFASDCESLTHGTDVNPDELAPPLRPAERPAGPEIRELYETTFPCGSAELWGWPPLEPDHRNSAPALGPVHSRLPSAMDESTRTRLRKEALEQRRHATESHSASTRMCHADRGPALHDVHWKGTVPRLIAEQTGAIVSPNGASYLYYRSGDLIGIHTDPYGLDLVVLTLLSGAVEPLHCHLHLADTPLEDPGMFSGARPRGGG